uniref:Conotoxin Bu3 n=1 Tax=Conus bullatus TaxID=89438 RepID=O163_CONBU|nr:RecName: Full=Conotoxin Bu3; Flags: Precursor [Conus bullatus]
MKLMCVLIVSVLVLTACQLSTADDTRDKQKDRLVRLFRKKRDSSDSGLLPRTCVMFGSMCDKEEHSICCYECDYKKGICV